MNRYIPFTTGKWVIRDPDRNSSYPNGYEIHIPAEDYQFVHKGLDDLIESHKELLKSLKLMVKAYEECDFEDFHQDIALSKAKEAIKRVTDLETD